MSLTGVRRGRILIARPDITRLWDQFRASFPDWSPAVVESKGTAANVVIVNTANRPWAVMDSQILVESRPDLHWQEVYFSPTGRSFEPSGLEIDAHMSVVDSDQALLAFLGAAEPSAIVLRVSPHTKSEYLCKIIRCALPYCVLIVEFYDASCHFDGDALSYIFSNNEAGRQDAIEGCAAAFHFADGVVVKMGGDAFSEWSGGLKKHPISVFPSLPSRRGVTRATSSGTRRALYAGSLSARELDGGIGSVDGANMIRYFDAFRHASDCSLHILNAAHTKEKEDTLPKFSALNTRYNGDEGEQNIRYRRGLPRQELITYAAEFDLGICCAHYEDDAVMPVTRFGLPNRMMTYLAAGLPVVIDNRFEYAAGLVRDFNAGAVVEAGDIDGFLELVRTLDLKAARSGVNALVSYMEKANELALQEVFELLTSGPSFFKSTIE